ncbi:hypothetical protein BX600DRAFT_473550 [Xylariales sp. PMI_506]|nr:hypothetical protein BX600DRAFT_473550 [Xylariales sp. PMI_506]
MMDEELDASASATTSAGYHHGRGNRRPQPVRQRSAVVAVGAPDTRGPAGQQSRQVTRIKRQHGLDLFHFDFRDLAKEMLLPEGGGESHISYHEYAVFTPVEIDDYEDDWPPEYLAYSIMGEGSEALRMFRESIHRGHGLNSEGEFVATPNQNLRARGRVRQAIVDRWPRSNLFDSGNVPDGFHLTAEDYQSMGLHAATLQSAQRITVESMFWNARRDILSIILSFSNHPQPPYDFLSMTYDLRDQTTTALIRRSFDTRWHDEESLDEYERRLDSARDRWVHPLVLPTVLLQVQLLRMEEAVVSNNAEVLEMEGHVDVLTGSLKTRPGTGRRRGSSRDEDAPFSPLKRLATIKEFVEEKVGRTHHMTTESGNLGKPDDDNYVPPQTIHLMKEAHDVLKGSIQLLDTLRWMERAVKLLMQAGDELDSRLAEIQQQQSTNGRGSMISESEVNSLSYNWNEIRQYLDCTWRLCNSLETDRRMSELRCRAQIDIIYSKMAQEDNNLNARMAVASTRDSSSMKALAVITAIFLPGEFISSLFGMNMFDWETGTTSDPALDNSDTTTSGLPSPVIMPLFWVYWAFTLPLTIFIVVLWRAWWVNQDRFFRRHLSMELSNERYWTTDGRPRDLETSFLQDFFSLFMRSGAGNSSNSTILGRVNTVREGRMSFDSQGVAGRNRKGTMFSVSPTLGKDAFGIDSDDVGLGVRSRARTISFARPPKKDPVSAV